MKARKIFNRLLFISLLLGSCENPGKDNSRHESKKQSTTETQYGSLPGGYTTEDEYYLNENGIKVWHGHRKTFYPNGQLKMDAVYEDGKELNWQKYDEVGNLTSSKK